MSTETTNAITFWVLVAPWPIWLTWEVVLLRRRGLHVNVQTISMVMRDFGWKCNVMPYVWSGLAAHAWWPSESWPEVWTQAAFWMLGLMLGVADICTHLTGLNRAEWPTWLRWMRFPLVWMVAGFFLGRTLFPQRGELP